MGAQPGAIFLVLALLSSLYPNIALARHGSPRSCWARGGIVRRTLLLLSHQSHGAGTMAPYRRTALSTRNIHQTSQIYRVWRMLLVDRVVRR